MARYIIMKNRKVILFFVTLVVVGVLAYFEKDTAAVVSLFGLYCAGNVGSKAVTHVDILRKEDNNDSDSR